MFKARDTCLLIGSTLSLPASLSWWKAPERNSLSSSFNLLKASSLMQGAFQQISPPIQPPTAALPSPPGHLPGSSLILTFQPLPPRSRPAREVGDNVTIWLSIGEVCPWIFRDATLLTIKMSLLYKLKWDKTQTVSKEYSKCVSVVGNEFNTAGAALMTSSSWVIILRFSLLHAEERRMWDGGEGVGRGLNQKNGEKNGENEADGQSVLHT